MKNPNNKCPLSDDKDEGVTAKASFDINQLSKKAKGFALDIGSAFRTNFMTRSHVIENLSKINKSEETKDFLGKMGNRNSIIN